MPPAFPNLEESENIHLSLVNTFANTVVEHAPNQVSLKSTSECTQESAHFLAMFVSCHSRPKAICISTGNLWLTP